jgi:hypothetical protein
MKLKKTIFKIGNYPQGKFPVERVKKIFENTKENIKGIFQHSSVLNEKGIKPLELGSVSNLEFNEEDGSILADIEFNEKGEGYFKDNILSGMSVEIADDKINKLAFLPVGINPQIPAAEFSEEGKYSFACEFQAPPKPRLTPEELLASIVAFDVTDCPVPIFKAMKQAWWDKIDIMDYANLLKNQGYEVTKKEPKVTEFSEKDVKEMVEKAKEEARKEMEVINSTSIEFEEMKNSGIITKAMEDAGLTKEFMIALNLKTNNGDVLEFGETKIEFSTFKNILKALPKLNIDSSTKNLEFKKNEANEEESGLLETAKLKGSI